ncbi:MAG: ABC transporter substrate-binding protein [Pseudomonadales bacterium]|nr:ABC transporter substrate-binding protein [Pseudomonadales bacterium]
MINSLHTAIRWKLIPSLLGLVLGVFMVAGAQASAKTTSGIEPDKLIGQLFDAMNDRLQASRELVAADRSVLINIGEEVLGPYVSFDKMAKQILGKHWRKITKDQQSRYTAAFKNRVSFAMASQYDPEQEYSLDVKGAKFNRKKNKALVKSSVANESSGKKYLIDYKLYYNKKNDNWQVYDVIVEGVSMLQSFKTASNEQMSRKGIEFLIAQLETETKEDEVKVKVQANASDAVAAQ